MPKQKSCMNIVLLICCQLCVLQAQEQHKINLKKLASPFNSPFKSIVFHATSDTQIPQPKIVVKWKSIDFLDGNGTLKKQFASNSDIFVKLSSNGEFIGVQHGQLQMYKRDSIGGAEFALLNGAGELLWKEPYKTYWDEPSDVYDVSSLGTVSKITWYEGTVTFYDKSGIKLANHLILAGANKGISGKWSSDGRLFAAASKDQYANARNQQQLLLFDHLGNMLWRQSLSKVSSIGIVAFSPHSEFVLITHRDETMKLKGAFFKVDDGSLAGSFEDDGFSYGKFSPQKNMVLAHLIINNVSHLALYDVPSGKRIFKLNTEGR